MNDTTRGTTKEGDISKKVQESRLKWHGHVMIREEGYAGGGGCDGDGCAREENEMSASREWWEKMLMMMTEQ